MQLSAQQKSHLLLLASQKDTSAAVIDDWHFLVMVAPLLAIWTQLSDGSGQYWLAVAPTTHRIRSAGKTALLQG